MMLGHAFRSAGLKKSPHLWLPALPSARTAARVIESKHNLRSEFRYIPLPMGPLRFVVHFCSGSLAARKLLHTAYCETRP